MKRKSKFTFPLVLALLLSLMLGVGAAAAESDCSDVDAGKIAEAMTEAENVTKSEMTPDQTDSENAGTDEPHSESCDNVLENTLTSDEKSGEVNIFEAAYKAIVSHADDLFSALAFVGTLIIAFCYKRGMLPLLSGALSKLGDAVAALREGSTECLEKTGAEVNGISERLSRLENSIDLFTKEIIDLEERLGSQSEIRADRESYRGVLLAEIDMLKDIFTSSALPQYQKDAVNEKVKKMKEELISNGESKK